MRSRYSAFALGLGRYLVHTLAAEHPDRALDEAALVVTLSRAKERQRFLGLTILEAARRGPGGTRLARPSSERQRADPDAKSRDIVDDACKASSSAANRIWPTCSRAPRDSGSCSPSPACS